jgi:hypothetical protein
VFPVGTFYKVRRSTGGVAHMVKVPAYTLYSQKERKVDLIIFI